MTAKQKPARSPFRPVAERAAPFSPIDPHKHYAPQPGSYRSEPSRKPIASFTTYWIQLPMQMERPMTSESLLLLMSEKTPHAQKAGMVAPIAGGPFAEVTEHFQIKCLYLGSEEFEIKCT